MVAIIKLTQKMEEKELYPENYCASVESIRKIGKKILKSKKPLYRGDVTNLIMLMTDIVVANDRASKRIEDRVQILCKENEALRERVEKAENLGFSTST